MVWIIHIPLLMNCPRHACPTGPCSQDFLRIACIHEPSTTSPFLQEVPSSAIPEGELCSLDRSSRVLLCVSKPLDLLQSRQIVREMPLIFRPLLARDVRDEDKSPKLPARLLSVIRGNIATAVMFAVLREQYASRMVRRQPGLSGS